MPKIKIIYDRKNCIGAGACVVLAEKFWKMGKDDKADLLPAPKMNKFTGKYELEIEVSKKDLVSLKEAADSCPAKVIEVVEI